MLGEKVACATVFPHLDIRSYMHVQWYLLLWQLHFDFGDFSSGACHIMRITIAERNPDTGLLTEETFARDNTMPIVTMLIASGQSGNTAGNVQ